MQGSTKTVKRFYNDVLYCKQPLCEEKEGEAEFALLLDDVIAKTPGGKAIIVPLESLAQEICKEYKKQEQNICPQTMVFTRITNTVLDGVACDVQPLIEDVLRYVSGDLLFYRAQAPQELQKREAELFDPILERLENKFHTQFQIGSGILPVVQSQEASFAIKNYLRSITERYKGSSLAFCLTAFHMITTLTGSILLAIAAFENLISLDETIKCAYLEEDWSQEKWGLDEETQQKKESRINDLRAAFKLLTFLNAKSA